jgi:hypothetical protein
MISIERIIQLAERYRIPIEDALFIALNRFGVSMDVQYNRMRMGFIWMETIHFLNKQINLKILITTSLFRSLLKALSALKVILCSWVT